MAGNFCGQYLGILKKDGFIKDITDGFLPVDTIRILSPPKNFIYKKPKFIFNKYLKERILVKPEIKRISLKDLKRLGFEIIKRKPRKIWFKNQRFLYRIVREDLGIHGLSESPPGHRIEYDIANNLLRLVGKNAGPKMISDWIEVR